MHVFQFFFIRSYVFVLFFNRFCISDEREFLREQELRKRRERHRDSSYEYIYKFLSL